jgi:hypothetical protein
MNKIKRYPSKGFIGINNILLENLENPKNPEEVKNLKFRVRYKSPAGNISETIYSPVDGGNKEHINNLYALWTAIRKIMEKAEDKPFEYLNPFVIANTGVFLTTIKKMTKKEPSDKEPQQMELDLKTARRVIERLRSLR